MKRFAVTMLVLVFSVLMIFAGCDRKNSPESGKSTIEHHQNDGHDHSDHSKDDEHDHNGHSEDDGHGH